MFPAVQQSRMNSDVLRRSARCSPAACTGSQWLP